MPFTQTIEMSELQEVGTIPPDTASDGAYDITFDEMTGMLTVSGAFESLTSALNPVGAPDSEGNPQSAIHVHVGRPGENGPIARNLTVTDNGDGSGTFTGSFTLTAVEIDRLEVRELYVNLHTTGNPGGELRGQMTPFDADDVISMGSDIPLQFGQQPGVGPADDGSSGEFDVTFNSDTNTLSISGTYSDVSGNQFPVGGADSEGNPESSMHVHVNTVDDNGPIARNLTVTDNGDGTGSYEGLFNLTAVEALQFLTGQFYINQHTDTNPAGGLRGQVIDEGNLSETITGRSIVLEESQEVGMVPDTAATGAFDVTYHEETNTLFLEGTYSDLTGAASAAHIHMGAAGINGGVIYGLTATDDGSGNGTITGLFTISDAEETALLAGELYVNIHTATNPGGELRGQVFTDELNRGEVVINSAALEEAQEVGAVPPDGAATGEFDVSFDPLTQELDISGTFSGLTSNLFPVGGMDGAGNAESAAHVHIGAAGTNGPIARNLTIIDNGDGSGSFANSFLLTDDEAAAFDQGLFYVNLHTTGNMGGELRGQLFQDAQQSGRLAIVDGVIEERQEVGTVPPDDDTTGQFNLLLDPETGVLQVSGTFADLTSPLNPVGAPDSEGNPQSAVHLHMAAAGANGGIARNLSTTENGHGSGTFTGSFTLTAAEIDSVLNDGIYFNLHTTSNPGGELRGQIFSSEFVAEDETGVINLLGTVQNGTPDDDVLTGLEDDDMLNGMDGEDILSGGEGDDVINGGSGEDELNGGDGEDTIMGGADGDILRGGADNDMIFGGEGGDLFYGQGGDDVVNGDSGQDLIYGGSGNDTISGGAGDDNLLGQSGNDRVDGDRGADMVRGLTGDDVLTGGFGRDVLLGGAQNDVLHGQFNGDALDGGSGTDFLFGGLSSDVFVFKQGNDLDVIRDWEDGRDRIDATAYTQAEIQTAIDDAQQFSFQLRLDFGMGDTLAINNVTATDITLDDFIF